MSAAAYAPTPGTVAWRAIAHLEGLPTGSEVMGAPLAEAIGATPSAIAACLQPALQAGIIFRRQRDPHPRSPFWWSLVDHAAERARATAIEPSAKPSIEAEEPEADQDARSLGRQATSGGEAATATTQDRTVTVEQRHADERRATASTQQPTHLVGITATVSMSGEVAVVAECGTVILFSAERGQRLQAFLARRAA